MSIAPAWTRVAEEAAARPLSARVLGLSFDDALAASHWRQAMLQEQLVFRDLTQAVGAASTMPEAVVLHLARGLTDQLGRLRELSARYPGVVLVVVGHALRELDQVLALEMGADDVLDADLGAPVVAAKLRALWRRAAQCTPAAAPLRLSFGSLQLNRPDRRVLQEGRPVELTEGEFELLWLLALNAGQTVTRMDLLQQLRGLRDVDADRSIDCRVYRIRAKLGDRHGRPQRIRTIRNRGYLFSPGTD